MFGEFVKQERLNIGLTLRGFCRRLDIDASNWSKIERGKLAPPQDEAKLAKIANVLGIKPHSEKYQELFDKAHIDARNIPPDLLSDKELTDALPLFFRAIRSEKPSEEQLDSLIKKTRGGI